MSSPVTDTPRTDAEIMFPGGGIAMVRPEFARQLERELDIAKAQLADFVCNPDSRAITTQEVFDNWSAYLRDVDREDFKAQLECLASSETKEMPETYWLIERGQAVNHAPTIWWQSLDDTRPHPDYPKCWTEDANRARKFLTREAAQKAAQSIFGNDGIYSITEHVFLRNVSSDKKHLSFEAWWTDKRKNDSYYAQWGSDESVIVFKSMARAGWDAALSARVPSHSELLEAAARGWCTKENSGKTVDPELALAIVAEIQSLYVERKE